MFPWKIPNAKLKASRSNRYEKFGGEEILAFSARLLHRPRTTNFGPSSGPCLVEHMPVETRDPIIVNLIDVEVARAM